MKTTLFYIIFGVFLVQVTFATSNARLHLIIFAATEDSNAKIANGIKVSYQNMQTVWQIASQESGYMLEEHLFVGENFSLSALNRFLRDFRCEKEDVVVFYFVGHGVAYSGQELDKQSWADLHFHKTFTQSQKDRFHQKNFQEIVKTLEKQSPRLLIALSESCNNTFIEGQHFPRQIIPRGKAIGIQSLLSEKGTFMLASAERNQVSYIDSKQGGVFNIAFYNTFIEIKSQKTINWKKFIDLVQEKSFKISQRCPTVQIPYALRKK